MRCNLIRISLWCALVASVENAKILCVFPFPALSHQIVYEAIWQELAARGHELTVITTHPIKNATAENVTEIDISFLENLLMNEHNFTKLIATEKNFNVLLNQMLIASQNISEEFFKNVDVQNLLSSGKKFDLILGELTYPAWFAMKDIFNCPLILMNSMPTALVGHDSVGNPTHPVLYPDFNLPFGPKLAFFEKLVSVSFSIYIRYLMHYRHYPDQYEVARKYLGHNISDVQYIQDNVDLIFTHTIPGFHPARPVAQTYIELFGLHMKPKKSLPRDLQEYLDDSTNGVIYMSFGSAVKSYLLPQEIIKTFLKAFAELPYKVLWKYEGDLVDMPHNVQVSPWYPQQDVLRHPNVKLFITHGGQQSISEAIYNNVPVIGVPFFGDQFYNTLRFEPLGMGIALDKDNLTEDVLKKAILEVIVNPKYRFKMKALADLAIDQPIKPLDKAIWWIEYVIRHKGAKHLRNPTVDMPFYQYFLLDVLAFLFFCNFVVLYAFKKLIELLFVLTGKFYRRVLYRNTGKIKTN